MFLDISDKHTPQKRLKVRGERTEWASDEYISMTYERDELKRKAEKRKEN